MKKQNSPILMRPDDGFRERSVGIRYKDYYITTSIHWHDYYEFEVITDGSASYFVNGVEYTLKRGSAYLVTPIDFHRIQGDIKLYNISFSDAIVSRELLDYLVTGNSATVVEFSEEDFHTIETLLRCLLIEYEQNNPLREHALKSLLESVLIGYLRRTNLDISEQGRSDIAVMRVVAYIKFNFKKKLTLGEVAEAVHLTPNYVGEVFSKKMGVSFNQYLMQTRLNYAKNLLLRGGMSVQEVALDSGFGSQTYFSDCFKREFGITPTDLKKNGMMPNEIETYTNPQT